MDKAEVDRWLDAYVAAWKSSDRDLIGALFAEDISYRFHPYDEPVTGRAAVVGAWLGEQEHPGASTVDAPGTFDAVYRTVAVDGDVAVATGSSTYLTEPGGGGRPGVRQLLRDALRPGGPVPRVHRVVHQAAASRWVTTRAGTGLTRGDEFTGRAPSALTWPTHR